MVRRGISAGVAALLLAFLSVALAACSTPYASSGILGGHNEKELQPGIWRVSFSGNGYTTYETVQTYWLYRCAELAGEKGFDGFEIVSNIRLVGPVAPEETILPAQLASVAQYYIPMYIQRAPMPFIEADVRLLRQPVSPIPGKVFDAADLKKTLEPLVNGAKCDGGNVCPHVHHYLYPAPAAPPSSPPTDRVS